MTRAAFAVVMAAALAGCATMPARVSDAPHGAATPAVPPGMQYLYGSGEGAAISIQAWRSLVAFVDRSKALQFRAPGTRLSVVLTADSTLAKPRFERCAAKPFAAVFDVDETVLLNLGFEYDASSGAPYSAERWRQWEREGAGKVAPVPGAVEALGALRQMGVTVIFNSNRSAANAAQTEAAIEGAGLGPARHGDTLFLAGDDATGSHKDGRRATIAARYCVLAMGGDQLGDFSDLFNAGLPPSARRHAVEAAPIAAQWGAGWFVMPNPVYGTALKGGADDVFPTDKRWAPPRPQEK